MPIKKGTKLVTTAGTGRWIKFRRESLKANFPPLLRKHRHWIHYDGEKRPRRILDTMQTAEASVTNPSHWRTFDGAYEHQKATERYAGGVANAKTKGLGYVFAKDRLLSAQGEYTVVPVGIDLDDVVTEIEVHDTHYLVKLRPWALKLMRYFKTYTELSPSRTGLHIFLPAHNGKGAVTQCRYVVRDEKGHPDGHMEIYDSRRYFTCTGACLSNKNYIYATRPRTAELRQLTQKLWAAEVPVVKDSTDPAVAGPGGGPEAGITGEGGGAGADSAMLAWSARSVETLLAILKESAQWEKFNKIWTGGTGFVNNRDENAFAAVVADYADNHSNAVHALCCIVAFYTGDVEVMSRVMAQSVLWRGKWASGKWERVGVPAFRQLRRRAVSSGDFYGSLDAALEAELRRVAALGTVVGVEGAAAGGAAAGGDDPLAGRVGMPDFSGTLDQQPAGVVSEFHAHMALVSRILGDVRKDLVSGGLFYRVRRESQAQAAGAGGEEFGDDGREWAPVNTQEVLGALEAECMIAEEMRQREARVRTGRGVKQLYKHSRMKQYLQKFSRDSGRGKLLLDVPEWDGKDRIEVMCKAMSRGLDYRENRIPVEIFTDLMRDWCARVWGRLADPLRVQNRCILLSGAQGIGKDVWIKSLVGVGLGHYFSDLTLRGKYTMETDIAVVMGSSIVMFISEFDKTEVLDVGTLKDLITKDSFTQVRKYDRSASTMANRCSVIAACNPSHVLRDVTGNRRFVVVRLQGGPGEAINWNSGADGWPMFSKAWSLQVLAQGRELWKGGYRTMAETENLVAAQNRAMSPADVNEDIIAEFESLVNAKGTAEAMLEAHSGFSNGGGVDDYVAANDVARWFEGQEDGQEGQEDGREGQEDGRGAAEPGVRRGVETGRLRLWKIGEIDREMGILSRAFGISRKDILQVLKDRGCNYRSRATGRWWGTRESCARGAEVLRFQEAVQNALSGIS